MRPEACAALSKLSARLDADGREDLGCIWNELERLASRMKRLDEALGKARKALVAMKTRTGFWRTDLSRVLTEIEQLQDEEEEA